MAIHVTQCEEIKEPSYPKLLIDKVSGSLLYVIKESSSETIEGVILDARNKEHIGLYSKAFAINDFVHFSGHAFLTNVKGR